MTKLNHSRPILKLIDNLQRENCRSAAGFDAPKRSLPPPPKETVYHWQSIEIPSRPDEDSNLNLAERAALNALLEAHSEFVLAYGSASPLFGKPSAKRKAALASAEKKLISSSANFIKFSAQQAQGGSLNAWHWLQDYCNAHRRNGNGIYDWLVSAVLESGLEEYFWSALRGSEIEQAELVSLVREIGKAA